MPLLFTLVYVKTKTDSQRAIELVQQAIVEDERHNYPEAYKKYQNSLDYFMLALKCVPTSVLHNLGTHT